MSPTFGAKKWNPILHWFLTFDAKSLKPIVKNLGIQLSMLKVEDQKHLTLGIQLLMFLVFNFWCRKLKTNNT
jgi:hypothetical protein